MTLFNGLKTILLIAMYLEYDKYRIVITRLYVYQLFNLIIRSNSVYFFNLYVLLIRAPVLYDVCYTLLSLGHFHPYAMHPEWFYDIFIYQPQLTF